jgi:hypothetical protein
MADEMNGEREAYIAWMLTYPKTFTHFDAEHNWKHGHVSALAWQARASLAANAGREPNGYQKALDIRIQEGGWELSGSKVPVLYTDSINGRQVCRDDVWLCTTEAFTHPSPPEGMAGWTKASEQLPPCRDNQLYIGVNSAGFAGVFNAVTSIAGNVYCHYETAEESIDVLGDLAIWKQFNPPIPASEAKGGIDG